MLCFEFGPNDMMMHKENNENIFYIILCIDTFMIRIAMIETICHTD